MTEEDVVKKVQDAKGELVPFPRSFLLNMWHLKSRVELDYRVERLCQSNAFESSYDQASMQFRIRLKD